MQSLIPFVLIFAIFWFLVIRPQQKKSKAHRALLENLKKGDHVITDSGIFGTIQKIAAEAITVEIAPKVAVRMVRSRVSEVVSQTSDGKAKSEDG